MDSSRTATFDILLRVNAEESHGTAPLDWDIRVCSPPPLSEVGILALQGREDVNDDRLSDSLSSIQRPSDSGTIRANSSKEANDIHIHTWKYCGNSTTQLLPQNRRDFTEVQGECPEA